MPPLYAVIALSVFGLFIFIFTILQLRDTRRLHRLLLSGVATSDSAVGVPPEVGVSDALISSLSQRLAATEGRLGTMAAQLEGIPQLQTRVASMETLMPSVQSAMEKYADVIHKAERRDTERHRREDTAANKEQPTAGEAAAALTAGSGAGGETPPLTQPGPANNKPMPWLRGSGGRGRR